MSRVVNLSVERTVPEGYVYVGRPSKWGNPFIEGRDGTRSEIIRKYRDYITSDPTLMSEVKELRGHNLGCWCHPKPCHADVLLELSNSSNLEGLIDDESVWEKRSRDNASAYSKYEDDFFSKMKGK